ncbi:M15 family metallopeptidase [Paucibacter sp. M5-1]|uniref:M15 family metallopeptidase n=1 Tax=Paucibacter sp. M5-1 TaxID=3015998 RepID=UPI0022B91119|nr:M15 family metallopeptidase [Paucibacter sp. M5-1]MCZ7881977.1 M15 family metallopeptidase [Paucibacter sp. M5-1]
MADFPLLADYGQAPRQARVLAKLNVREQPSRQSALKSRLDPAVPGQAAVMVDQLLAGEPYLGEPRWYRLNATGHYAWSGALELQEVAPPLPTSGMRVNARNNVILPLSTEQIEQVFGRFSYVDAVGGAVRITEPANWESTELVPLQHPVLAAIAPRLRVHRKALGSFTRALDAIQQAGLSAKVLSCSGTWVSRYIGWNPASGRLSSHSWGIAIDLNAAWNGYGREPAPPGSIGSVYELLPFFVAEGFAWGGHFSPRYRDGMHFELARQDL